MTTFVLKNLRWLFDKYAAVRTEHDELVKSRTKIFSNFVAFSEIPNFTWLSQDSTDGWFYHSCFKIFKIKTNDNGNKSRQPKSKICAINLLFPNNLWPLFYQIYFTIQVIWMCHLNISRKSSYVQIRLRFKKICNHIWRHLQNWIRKK